MQHLSRDFVIYRGVSAVRAGPTIFGRPHGTPAGERRLRLVAPPQLAIIVVYSGGNAANYDPGTLAKAQGTLQLGT